MKINAARGQCGILFIELILFTRQESCPPVEIFHRETAFLTVFTAVLSHEIINTEIRIEKITGRSCL